jgi:hypothetical protein
VVDRARGLQRLHPCAQRRPPAALQGDAGRDAGRDSAVKRRALVVAAAALCAGLAATLAATAREPRLVDPGRTRGQTAVGATTSSRRSGRCRRGPTWATATCRRPVRPRARAASKASSPRATSRISPSTRRRRTCRRSTAATT